MRVLGVGRGEGRSLSEDDEKNDGRSENVDAGSLVGLAQVDLGSHVRGSAELGLEKAGAVSAAHGGGETQIRDLQGEVLVEEQVLGFEVTMCVAVAVHVAEAFEELLEVVASLILGEATAEGDEVEELTAADQLKHDELDSLLTLLGVSLLAFANFHEADDVRVVQGGQGLDLHFDELIEGLVGVENLDGVASAGGVLGKLDLAGDTASEGSTKDVLVEGRGHFKISEFVLLKMIL